MILVALDGSQGAWQALEQAITEGSAKETWLLVHVIPDPQPHTVGFFAPFLEVDTTMLGLEWGRVGQNILEQGKHRLKTHFGADCEVLMRLEQAHNQTVGQLLAQIIRDEAPRLVVLGAHGDHPEMGELGRTARFVLEHERQNTLVVHPDAFENPYEPLHHGGVR